MPLAIQRQIFSVVVPLVLLFLCAIFWVVWCVLSVIPSPQLCFLCLQLVCIYKRDHPTCCCRHCGTFICAAASLPCNHGVEAASKHRISTSADICRHLIMRISPEYCRWYVVQPYQKRRRMSSTEERILAHAVAAGIDLPSIKARALAPLFHARRNAALCDRGHVLADWC